MSLLEHINDFDRWAVMALNQHYTPFMDRLMWEVSTLYLWIPLYLTVALLLYLSYRRRAFRIFVIFVAIIMCVNILGDEILKPLIGRPRPAYVSDMASKLHLVTKPNGHRYFGAHDSHPSGHAATTFAFIMLSLYYLWTTLRRRHFFLMFGIAYVLLVSFSRIYLCVHYPTDILGGYLLGGLIVTSWILFLRKWDAPLLDAYRMEDIDKTYNHSPLVITDC